MNKAEEEQKAGLGLAVKYSTENKNGKDDHEEVGERKNLSGKGHSQDLIPGIPRSAIAGC